MVKDKRGRRRALWKLWPIYFLDHTKVFALKLVFDQKFEKISLFLTRFPMQNRWALPGHASAVKSSSSTSGDALLAPPFPPDTPDLSSSLSLHMFPPLALTPPNTCSEIRRSHLSPTLSDTVMTQAQHSSSAAVIPETIGSLSEIESQLTIPATGNPNPLATFKTTNSSLSLEQFVPTPTDSDSNKLKVLPPKHNSLLITNRASKNSPLTIHTQPTQPLAESVIPPTTSTTPITLHPPTVSPPILPPPSSSATLTLAEKLCVKGDKSLKILAPITLSEQEDLVCSFLILFFRKELSSKKTL